MIPASGKQQMDRTILAYILFDNILQDILTKY
ncbi:hypothetical protein ALO_17206 [Acetonema longum DSM 6540]|uniref:Uncharacterized protein n=1 Tax=Acetonema longum DSM 6540 TaxID=1009370 RepID=F7NMV8_9FIRM|nr:hypothetical protein ALO_17206 [Acetonema longum DSM 6540]